MKIACIDVGSNTIRLLIGDVKRGTIKKLKSRRVVTALAKGLSGSQKLNDKGKSLTLKALKDFLTLCKLYDVAYIFAIGTSAMRDSLDGQDFLDIIKVETGLEIEIISGQREAYLNYEGIISTIDLPQKAFIIDIGGGSTEWIYKDDVRLIHSSMPVGAIKLYDSFIHKDPPTEKEIDHTKTFIQSELSKSELTKLSFNNSQPFIVTGGTATTLASIDLGLSRYNSEKVHLHKIAKTKANEIFHHLISIPLVERAKVRGLEKKRAGIIITGLLILMSVMDFTGFQEVIISDFGLLEGLIYEKTKAIDWQCI